MLEPDEAEQHNANSCKNPARDHANGSERGEEVSAFITRESPGAAIEHQRTKSGSNRWFDTARSGRQFSR